MASVPVGRRRIILLLLLTAVLLLTVDLRGNSGLDRVRNGFVWVLAPFETAAQVVSRPVIDAWRGVSQFDAVREENQRLQAQLDAQRGAEIAARNAIAENQRLRALNELESLADIPTVTASVIGGSPSNIDQVIELDRGSAHGIEVGMAVVNEAGLIGKVTRVFTETSLVMLLTDPRYAVEVKVLAEETPVEPSVPDTVPSGLPVDELDDAAAPPTSAPDPDAPETTDPTGDEADPFVDDPAAEPDPTDDDAGEESADPDDTDVEPGTTTTTAPPLLVQRETGALLGQGAGRLPQVNFVTISPTLGRLGVGDAVFTTGGRTSLAPPDIPVGTIANVITRPGSGGTRLEVRPAADLDRLQFVRVVLYKPPVEMGG